MSRIDVIGSPPRGAPEGPPARRRRPHRLTHQAWALASSRFIRNDVPPILDALEGCRRVLDVGGGTGVVARRIAERFGACTTVEPDAESASAMDEQRREGVGIRALRGRAESLPLGEGSFDGVVATWVLHYVDDVVGAVQEMIRVCDKRDPGSRVLIVQGAPDNEMIGLLSRACCAVAGDEADDHEALLATAAEVLSGHGFRNIDTARVNVELRCDEADLEERIARAAEVLQRFWYDRHPAAELMKSRLSDELRAHFTRKPGSIGNDGVLLVARR
ncbi:methyltransferase domain-containing protein [Sorangium sp. So ce260]|uniref:class I SAM-dependent methyltransferase n=1 Tax=Sorangium sp. So ce260 TaxID=3133291 RepID=UPI003F5E489E